MDTNLVYESVIATTQSTSFLIALGIVWLLPLLVYILIGALRGAKTPSGRTLSKKMIQTSSFWISWSLWFFLQAILITLLIIFPIWLKL